MATRFDDFKPYINVVIRNWKDQQKASANRIPFHMKASHLDTDEDKLRINYNQSWVSLKKSTTK